MSVRPGMERCIAGLMRSPTKPAPIRPDRPMPRMVSARPVATWLTASPSAISAKITDIAVRATEPERLCAGHIPNPRATKVGAGRPGPAKAAGRADDHHAFDAEVEHA